VEHASKPLEGLLEDWSAGDSSARDEVIALLYPSLRDVAARALARERGAISLHPTDLLHEALIKLMRLNEIKWVDRAHVLGLSATVMRQVLIDRARRRSAAKREGEHVTLVSDLPDAPADVVDLIALDDALNKLAMVSADAARVVELRYFSGLSIPEVATVLGASESTVKRHWAAARAWLADALGEERDEHGSGA